ncbi:hypothetical protein GCM10018952_04610 [Streptosporangium vulgare]
MAREDRTALETTKAQVRNPSLTWALKCGAGDGNRTRAVGLGSASSTAGETAELGVRLVVSDRGCPLVTLSNCTLIARLSPRLHLTTWAEPANSIKAVKFG